MEGVSADVQLLLPNAVEMLARNLNSAYNLHYTSNKRPSYVEASIECLSNMPHDS